MREREESIMRCAHLFCHSKSDFKTAVNVDFSFVGFKLETKDDQPTHRKKNAINKT